MVKAEGSWLSPPHSTRKLPNFDCMTTSLDPAQLQCLPECMNPGTRMTSANMAMPGLAVSSTPNFMTQQGNEAYGEGVRNPIPGCQRRFLVFDQSGNEQRLIYSSFGPPVPKPTATDAKPIPGYFDHNEYAARMDQTKLMKLPEVSDENHFTSEESEMHEDTEEINALLYSDDDYYDENGGGSDDDGDDSDDDEVRSTGHSPILIKSHGTQEQAEKIIEEEGTSSDGPNKRQKLMDGGYKKSSLVDSASSVKVERFHGYDDDMESNYAKRQSQDGEMISILSSKQFRKDKIRATLKILESIIPGAKDKEPLLVLDEAIDYLKSLKLKAKTVGVSYL
uniref:Transcription factor bHLH143-like isoform X1 n=1 Tax=Populus alba TaxID=43335 RepID=A0A4U5PR80_POPAL|nr:transcription factor bHLH143-like isoform X1 [Populus alba]